MSRELLTVAVVREGRLVRGYLTGGRGYLVVLEGKSQKQVPDRARKAIEQFLEKLKQHGEN